MADKKIKYYIVEFQDGLQIVPTIWMSSDLKRAKWPNFVSNSRYDKAVKCMEEPEATWQEHSVLKIYAACSTYAEARRKLKLAEELSDVNTCSEREEYLKKTRKVRAAKTLVSSSDNSSELSDETISSIPKPPNKRSDTTRPSKKKEILPYKHVKNVKSTVTKISQDDNVNISCSSYGTSSSTILEVEEDNIYLKNVKSIDKETRDDSVFASCSSYGYAIPEMNDVYRKNVKSIDKETRDDSVLASYSSCAITAMEEDDVYVQSAENNLQTGYFDKENISPAQSKLTKIINYKGGSDFECYVVKKLQYLEINICNIAKRQKQILDKMSITALPEEQNRIDILQDLPVKNKNDLETMEIKLGNDVSYRNEMIKQLARLTTQEVKHSCLCLMRQTVSNEVAVLFSWHGAKEKESFSKLILCKVILRVIRNAHENVKDGQISSTIKIWLAHAKERMNREREREKKGDKRDLVQNEPQEPEERH